MKINRTINETVVMSGDEVKSFITKYITKKTGKKVINVELDNSDYLIKLEEISEADEITE